MTTDIKAQIRELEELLVGYDNRESQASNATIRASLKELLEALHGFEFDADWEWGQMNGAGVIEPGDNREWFHEKNMDGHRRVITFTGPWEPWSWAQERPDLVVPPKVKAEKTMAEAQREYEKAQAKLEKAQKEYLEASAREERSSGSNFELQDQDESEANFGG